MEPSEARKLATRIAMQSVGVIVKFGRTNGRSCLHLIKVKPPSSETIFEEWEWSEHPWNTDNRQRKEQHAGI